jgi:hypothetical protein
MISNGGIVNINAQAIAILNRWLIMALSNAGQLKYLLKLA